MNPWSQGTLSVMALRHADLSFFLTPICPCLSGRKTMGRVPLLSNIKSLWRQRQAGRHRV